jgi:NADH-quinone oxidoreductase subunit N
VIFGNRPARWSHLCADVHVAGLGFKLGAAPFHMWVPDVYHGAPTAVTLFIGSAPKLAAFAFVIRLLVQGLGAEALLVEWQQMLVLMAVLSLAIGNVAAIAQTNLKRMLAYSTISHMGFCCSESSRAISTATAPACSTWWSTS